MTNIILEELAPNTKLILNEENEVIVYAEDCSKPEIVISDKHVLDGGKDFSYPVTVL